MESFANGTEVSGKFVIGKFVQSRVLHHQRLGSSLRDHAQIDGRIVLAHPRDHIDAVPLEVRTKRGNELLTQRIARSASRPRTRRRRRPRHVLRDSRDRGHRSIAFLPLPNRHDLPRKQKNPGRFRARDKIRHVQM
jgi:hypothetical protein